MVKKPATVQKKSAEKAVSKSNPNVKSKTTEQTNGEFELKPEQLRWTCPTSMFKFETTAELEPLDKIIGQPRAVASIKLGAEMFSKGYNIFISGLAGTGRLSTVKKLLEEVTTYCPITYDYCYVNNFSDPDSPRLIKLEKGRGKELSKMMDDAIAYLRQKLSKLFDEEQYQTSRKLIIEDFQQKEKDVLHHFDDKIKPFGFVRGQIENDQGISQPEVFPVVGDQPIQIDDLEEKVTEGTVTREQADEFVNNYRKFHNEIYDLARSGLKLMQEFRNALNTNDRTYAELEVQSVLQQIKDKFVDNERVALFIDEVKSFTMNNLSLFLPTESPVNPLTPDNTQQGSSDRFSIFAVNVVLDNSTTVCAPLITEKNPTFTNMFGTIERSFDANTGNWKTDFTKIKAGSILKADQGYLIVNALDLFNEAGVWNELKRVLLYDQLEIQQYEAVVQLSQLHIKPEPIDVKVKVIIIGGLTLYTTLYEYEKGFKKIFKINAQFDYETEKTPELIHNVTRFIAKICKEDSLPPCSPDGAAAIVEWAVDHAGSQKRITLKFSDVADVIREAAFYRNTNKHEYICREDVKEALRIRRYRNDMMDEKLKYYITEGITLIDTEGERVGQVNGLTVMDTGLIEFGKPARITANISCGTAGIINIEREAEMSGSIHNKGVMILSGFLRERFAKKKPLNFSASIAFEQSYGGIDGDSATAAEIYVLLSAISEVPIKQSIALTGSVNQKGDIQPIGGVNDKITGFYETCKERGLTGAHGVIIPVQNVDDLMLSEELIDSVKEGKFHIWAFSKIEEGVPLLMGISAGEMKNDGTYPKDSLFGKVEARLQELRIAAKDEKAKTNNKKKKKVKKPEPKPKSGE
ncbi:MAG: AAA family ATPase [Bacteroidota bacterium]